MSRVGGKLIQRRIDRQPQPASVALVDVDLGPGVVIEGAAHEHEADVDPRRNPERACHGDEERRVLVAVADFRPQHLTRRRNAHRRLLLEQAVDVAGQTFDSRAGSGDAADGALRFGADGRIVALDQRFRRDGSARREIGRRRAQ